MTQSIHILNQMGVMVSFSVAKKITEDEINKYFSKQKRTGKTEEQIGQMLQERILSELTAAIEHNEIPGLVSTQELAETLGMNKNVISKIPELNRIIMVVTHKLSEKKYDKMSLCFFINSLINMLGLTEEDFINFHQQNNTKEPNGDDPEDPEDPSDLDDSKDPGI